ncbi:HxlR family transcriptional regulator [Nonomuraea fuscirosea]|uniref:HxlR family transcriptional regulator n=1 Tax=Nonomuraea fuscirosea TaxID=1291556 RepID=A0A2T0LXS5_9ACTN|nr:helix-turn-helix domain-containing protein [Nonomuraea fuscirosea]PRX48797.1 HxlR family transcriptional regulator [Nonomuraea fuscirosea]
MTGRRKYGDGCAAAHALDLVGERWGLLIVRELLLGPKRFTDLREGLPAASSNSLSLRLKDLEESGVIRRRKYGSPATVWVYELTEWGKDLEPILIHLGRWGRRSPVRDRETPSSVDALMLAMRSRFRPEADPALSMVMAIRLAQDLFSVKVDKGFLTIERGDPAHPDVVIDTDLPTLATLVRQAPPKEALPTDVKGDQEAAWRFFSTL